MKSSKPSPNAIPLSSTRRTVRRVVLLFAAGLGFGTLLLIGQAPFDVALFKLGLCATLEIAVVLSLAATMLTTDVMVSADGAEIWTRSGWLKVPFDHVSSWDRVSWDALKLHRVCFIEVTGGPERGRFFFVPANGAEWTFDWYRDGMPELEAGGGVAITC